MHAVFVQEAMGEPRMKELLMLLVLRSCSGILYLPCYGMLIHGQMLSVMGPGHMQVVKWAASMCTSAFWLQVSLGYLEAKVEMSCVNC